MPSLLTDHSIEPFIDQDLGKVNLLGLSFEQMKAFFLALGEKAFRAQQVMQSIHQRGIADMNGMSNLSKSLRQTLADIAVIAPPEVVSQQASMDGTQKWAIRVTGGGMIETVFIPDGNRGTLCVSSQVGCSLDCSFCATGKQGFQRNLKPSEIIGQVWLAVRSLQKNTERLVTNVVMMGMGEPLLNFDAVVIAMNLMMHDHAYGLSKRRVTLSTSGVVPALDELSKHTDVSLAVSLHAPTNELRNQLVPINKKYPIDRLLASCLRYMNHLPDKRRVMTIEYTLIREVNDSDEQARQLAVLLKDVPCKINLIPFNEFELSSYRQPSRNRIRAFQQVLTEAGFITVVRTTRGDDIAAACGQLAGHFLDKTKRHQRHVARSALIASFP